jgi:low molecular weight protein-tyrosine phosphatase
MRRPAQAGRSSLARPRPTRILFVCLGNICRSPTAEGVMRELVARAGLSETIELDSAGTGGWHVGSAPDERATAAAGARGIALEGSARQVSAGEFPEFDLLIAMDRSNLRELRRLAGSDEQRARVRLLREFDPASGAHSPEGWVGGDLDVPDPYYGSPGGFEEVLDLVQAACEGLLAQIVAGEVP